MKLNAEALEMQNKGQIKCEIKPIKTVEGKYKVSICENTKINNKSN